MTSFVDMTEKSKGGFQLCTTNYYNVQNLVVYFATDVNRQLFEIKLVGNKNFNMFFENLLSTLHI